MKPRIQALARFLDRLLIAIAVASPIDRILTTIAVALVAAIVVIVNIQVVARYILSIGLSWPEELARHLLVWLVFIGGALALRRGEMIRVTWVVDHVPERFRPAFVLLREGITAVALLVLTYASLPLLGAPGNTTEPGAGIPARWVYVALPIGTFLMALFVVAAALRRRDVPSVGNDRERESADPPGKR